jgi:ribosomal protein S16
MDKQIAVIGFGSLIWDPRNLKLKFEWYSDGPVLPIEFSRISSDGRLTLVIDEENGTEVQTLYAFMDTASLEEAVMSLKEREGTNIRNIGYYCPAIVVNQRSKQSAKTQSRINDWLHEKGFHAVIWTDLASNFEEKQKTPFSIDAAFYYVNTEIPENIKSKAIEYINKSPIQTQFRKKFFTL